MTVIDSSMDCPCLLCNISPVYSHQSQTGSQGFVPISQNHPESAGFHSDRTLQLISQFNASSTTQKELIKEKS